MPSAVWKAWKELGKSTSGSDSSTSWSRDMTASIIPIWVWVQPVHSACCSKVRTDLLNICRHVWTFMQLGRLVCKVVTTSAIFIHLQLITNGNRSIGSIYSIGGYCIFHQPYLPYLYRRKNCSTCPIAHCPAKLLLLLYLFPISLQFPRRDMDKGLSYLKLKGKAD